MQLYNTEVNTLRDIALKFESVDIVIAYQLMTIVHTNRPKGPLIIKKMAEYRKKLPDINPKEALSENEFKKLILCIFDFVNENNSEAAFILAKLLNRRNLSNKNVDNYFVEAVKGRNTKRQEVIKKIFGLDAEIVCEKDLDNGTQNYGVTIIDVKLSQAGMQTKIVEKKTNIRSEIDFLRNVFLREANDYSHEESVLPRVYHVEEIDSVATIYMEFIDGVGQRINISSRNAQGIAKLIHRMNMELEGVFGSTNSKKIPMPILSTLADNVKRLSTKSEYKKTCLMFGRYCNSKLVASHNDFYPHNVALNQLKTVDVDYAFYLPIGAELWKFIFNEQGGTSNFFKKKESENLDAYYDNHDRIAHFYAAYSDECIDEVLFNSYFSAFLFCKDEKVAPYLYRKAEEYLN